MKRLAIITTHPIQYNAPLFKMLSERQRVLVKVFYTWGERSSLAKFDPGFERMVEWDIPLLNGYSFEWVKNTAKDPGSHHFTGIINPDLIEKLQQFNPNALLVFGWSFQSHLQVLRKFAGKVNILFRGDSTLLDSQSFIKRLFKKVFLRWVYKHIDKTLYVGKESKKYFIEYGLKESQLVFAPHAIDNARFNFTPTLVESGNILRRKLDIPLNAVVFLFAGKLEVNKDPEILVEAFLKLASKDSHLVIAGSGSLEKKLKKMAGGNLRIHFPGFQNQSEMPAIYNMADVYVLPSKSETWGLAVNEAMACGKAVLVSDKCGCSSDLVKDGVNGYVFKTGSVSALADRLQGMTNKSLLSSFGTASHNIIQHYSFEQVCKAIEDNS